MKIMNETILINAGSFYLSRDYSTLREEINKAILNVVWPEKSDKFIINPTKKANGVKSIKALFLDYLKNYV